MKNLFTISILSLLSINWIGAQTVTDYDGNVYNTVTIGTQTWMKENLKTLHYADGTAITGVSAYNADNNNVATYGRLYTWDAAMYGSTVEKSQGVCPTGWHVANAKEWDTLITFLGGSNIAGGKLKESGTTHWTTPNTGADNTSGFSALPGGFYFNSMMYVNINTYAKFWTSTQITGAPAGAYNCAMQNNTAQINDGSSSPVGNDKTLGASIRCIQGLGYVGIQQKKTNFEIDVYPNPAEDFIIIGLQNNPDRYEYKLFDATGRQILKGNLDNLSTKIELHNLSKGIYMLKTSNNISEVVKKIIIK
jgi:uncharacterized protein (TIGR02145 family)